MLICTVSTSIHVDFRELKLLECVPEASLSILQAVILTAKRNDNI